MHNSQL